MGGGRTFGSAGIIAIPTLSGYKANNQAKEEIQTHTTITSGRSGPMPAAECMLVFAVLNADHVSVLRLHEKPKNHDDDEQQILRTHSDFAAERRH